MNDRTLGYVLMTLIFCLVACLAVWLHWGDYAPLETRTLRFPEVGSLAVEDPVRMEGTLVGEIRGFLHDDSGRVLVFIRSPKPIPIRTSSRAAVKVKGVMGERFIEIGIGNRNDPLIGKDQIVDGVFEMGPSEAIVYMDLLHEKIIELKDIMLWLRDGRDDGKRPFIVAFNDVMEIIDSLTWKLLAGVANMEASLNDGFDMAADITVKAVKLTADVSTKTPELIDDLSSLMTKIDALVPKIENLLIQIDLITETVDENKILWGEHAEKIQKALTEIRKYANQVRSEGLPLNIRLRF